MARVSGRTIHPTSEEEKAVLHKLGLKSLRVSRKHNPYSVARRLKRAARPHPDFVFLQELVIGSRAAPPQESSEEQPVAAVELVSSPLPMSGLDELAAE